MSIMLCNVRVITMSSYVLINCIDYSSPKIMYTVLSIFPVLTSIVVHTNDVSVKLH